MQAWWCRQHYLEASPLCPCEGHLSWAFWYFWHCSKNRPIQRFIVRFIATPGVTDKIMPYLNRLSFGSIYRSDKRFIENLLINRAYSKHYFCKNYVYLCFVDLVKQYVLLSYFVCHYTRIQRLGIKVTLLSNIFLVLNIAYFSVGNLGFAKNGQLIVNQ